MGIKTFAARMLLRGAGWLSPSASLPSYDAAGTGPRLSGWRPGGGSPNLHVFSGGENLRRRSRDMARRNPYAQSVLDKYVSNAIGTGIRPRSVHPDPEKRKEIQEAWRRWVDEADADGVTNFYGLQVIALRSMMEGADCFGRFRFRRPGDGLSVPLQIQLLESEMVPYHLSRRLTGGGAVRAGVEYDALGRRVAYHILPEHPGEPISLGRLSGQASRVPAENVFHLFRPLRPGQVRGVPALASVLLRLYELDSYEDNEQVRQRNVAAFSGFIVKGLDPDGNPVQLGSDAGTDPDDDAIAIVKAMTGGFPVLNQGEDVRFTPGADIGAGVVDFIKSMQRGIASGGRVTKEQLTGDLSDVNYTSHRGGLLEFRRECEQFQTAFFIFQACRPVWRHWMRAAILADRIHAPDFRDNPEHYLGSRWMPQGFRWVDPFKEVQALIRAIRAGLISRAEAVQMSGFDVEVIDEQMAADNARADDLGLILDSDPRRTSGAGLTQARPDGSDYPSDEDGDEKEA